MEAQLSRILEIYDLWQSKRQLSKDTPVHAAFEDAKLSIERLPTVRGHLSVQVRFGYGKGKWAAIPWISVDPISRARVSDIGLHIFMLFRGDRTGVYLTITQGIGKLLAHVGKRSAGRLLFKLKNAITPSLSQPIKDRFQIDSLPDLRSLLTIAAAYQAANIVHRFYSLDELNHRHDMGDDLVLLLREFHSIQRIYMSALNAEIPQG